MKVDFNPKSLTMNWASVCCLLGGGGGVHNVFKE